MRPLEKITLSKCTVQVTSPLFEHIIGSGGGGGDGELGDGSQSVFSVLVSPPFSA